MQIRTVCVADSATHARLQALVEQMPQCLVLAWLRPDDLPAAMAGIQPDLVLVAPGLDLALVDPLASYVVRESFAPFELGVVALPVVDGIRLCPAEDIIRVHGEGNYVRVVFRTGADLILAKAITDFEVVFRPGGFMRVHRSNLVNLKHARRLIRGKAMRLYMSNGDEVEVSPRYRDALMARFPMPRRKR